MKPLEIIVVTLIMSLMWACAPQEAEPKQDDVFSVKENGQDVFYSSSDKAFGNIHLGMPKYMVDSISIADPNIVLSNREYDSWKEYSNNGMLSSFYLSTDTLANQDQVNEVVDEIEDVISVKYGQLNMTFISELPELGIANYTMVGDNEVHWGSHWNEGSKYIALGVQPLDSLNKKVWVWIFNTNLWEQLGEDKAQQEANKF